MASTANGDLSEIEKFNRLAEKWWNPTGPMGMLHTVNPLRLDFIMQNVNVSGLKVLDIGCGAGILTESLAKAGAQVTGVDLAELPLAIAKKRAQEMKSNIQYLFENIENMVDDYTNKFDIITCMEVLEHVPNPKKTIKTCAKLLKPGGHLFFSTLNRNFKSFLFVIVGAEYVFRILPKGTHLYQKLIRPVELETWAKKSGLSLNCTSSLMYNPFNKSFKLKNKIDINYIMHFTLSK